MNHFCPVYLDVSALPAPEPFHKIFEALMSLSRAQYLVVTHRKQPHLLYRPLIEQGYLFHLQKGKAQPFEIIIWQKHQPMPIEVSGISLAQPPDSDAQSSCEDWSS